MTGTPVKLLAKVAAVSLSLSPCLVARTDYPVACSAFDGIGDSATVTVIEQKLALQISRASGGLLSLSTSVTEGDLAACKVFFDKDSRYVAVGLNHLGPIKEPLRIIVIDLTAGRFIGDFTVPNAGLGASLKLTGFLQNKTVLVVLGSGAPDQPTTHSRQHYFE